MAESRAYREARAERREQRPEERVVVRYIMPHESRPIAATVTILI
jgi:hypothetical protein